MLAETLKKRGCQITMRSTLSHSMKQFIQPARDNQNGQHEVGNKVDETQISATTNLNQNENADSSPLNSRFDVEEPYEDLVASLTDDMLEKLYHVYCCTTRGLFYLYDDLERWEEEKEEGYDEFDRTDDIQRYNEWIERQKSKLKKLISSHKSDRVVDALLENIEDDSGDRHELYELVEDRYERIAS